MKEKYDVVIAGAGPAGCVAARLLAEQRMSVLLCEKREKVGFPVRCAELGGYADEMARFVRLDESVIVNRLNFCRAISPSGRAYERPVSRAPLMLDRERFDARLFKEALEAGAEGMTGAEIADADRGADGRIASIRVKAGRAATKVRCDFLVAADGVESQLGRMIGFTTTCPLENIYSCYQYRVENYEGQGATISFFVGNKVAPRGYVWVFPRGKGTANVGIGQVGSGSDNRLSPKAYLDRFMAGHLPKARITGAMAGGIPADGGLKDFVGKNAVLIGDAAHHANPFSGGGIMNSMEDAELFVRTLMQLIGEGKTDELWRYRRIHFRKYGWILRLQRIARNSFYCLTDGEMERLFSAIDKRVDREHFDYRAFLKAMALGYIGMVPHFLPHLGEIFG